MNDTPASPTAGARTSPNWRRHLVWGVPALLAGVTGTIAVTAAHAAAPGMPPPLLAGMAGAALATYWTTRSAVEGSVILREHGMPLDEPPRGPMAVLADVALWSVISTLVSVLSPWTARARRRAPATDDGAYTTAWRARMYLVAPAIVLEGLRWRAAADRSELLMRASLTATEGQHPGNAGFLVASGLVAAFPLGALLLWTVGPEVAVVACAAWLVAVDVATMTLSAAARARAYTLALAETRTAAP